MTIHILPPEQQSSYDQQVLEMLKEGDNEFVPPLSFRSSTIQSDLSAAQAVGDGVMCYFQEMKKQRLLVAAEDGRLMGFVSFRENYVSEPIKKLPNIYISTLLVHPTGRGKGLTKRMYEVLFQAYAHAHIFTRTWSTNEAHIRILADFGFEAFHVLKNHRGDGIDTVYFKKLFGT